MSAADYIITFVSIVFGLALTDLATSLHRLLRAGRRVKWDWLAPVAALLVGMSVVNYWWSFYQRMEVSDLAHFGTFLPVLGELLILFLLASAVLPDEVPEAGLDLRAFYMETRVYFWGLFLLLLVWTTTTHIVTRFGEGAGLWGAVGPSLDNIVAIVVFAAMAWVRRPWVHTAVLVGLVAFSMLDWHAMRVGDPAPAVEVAKPSP
jgi:hypothetical protein